MIDAQTAPYAAFVLRVSLAVLFLAHGWLKVAVHKPAGTVQYFQSLGLPGAFAYLTIAAELGGGTLLLFGVLARWVALALIPLILGTIVFVHGKNGWMFTNKDGGWEYPAFWAVALAVLAMLGDGAFALVRSPWL
jgi:putative oxidoreductase